MGSTFNLKVPINLNNVTLQALRPASGGTRDWDGRAREVRSVRSCMSSRLCLFRSKSEDIRFNVTVGSGVAVLVLSSTDKHKLEFGARHLLNVT